MGIIFSSLGAEGMESLDRGLCNHKRDFQNYRNSEDVEILSFLGKKTS